MSARAVRRLAWFVPGWAAVAVAALGTHPLLLIPLLLANALTMAAVSHAIGFDPEPSFARTALRRGAAHLVMFSSYTALVFLLIAWPMLRLTGHPSLGDALLLAAALVVSLGALWRVWPAFGLVFLWDDAYPEQHDGSWIFTSVARSLAFGRHLAHEERFFTHFLPAALSLLVLAFGAVTLTGMYGVLPAEMRTAALAIYGLAVLPLASLVIANRTLRALLCERHRPARPEGGTPAAPGGAPVPPPAVVLGEVEGHPGESRAAALLAAVRAGDIERALALLEAGADPDTAPGAHERDRRPVLTLAAVLPDTRLLRALIARGADVNRRQCGLGALLAATRDSLQGRPEAVLTLLTNGADPAVTDAEGNSPLHGAVLSEEPNVTAMLLDAGAPVNLANKAGLTPLGVACGAANWTQARFLLEHGAKPALPGGVPALVAAAGIAEDDAAGVKLLLKHRVAVNATDPQQRTALLAAASEGHVQIARVLLAAGADADLADGHGTTATMEAARGGNSALLDLLAGTGADAARRDSHGRDALTLACQSPRADAATVRTLLALGADPHAAGEDGRSALDHAAGAGRWDLVALLDPERPLPASLGDDADEDPVDAPADLLDALRRGQWGTVATYAARVRQWPMAQRAQLYLELLDPPLGLARRWLLDHGLAAEARLPAPADADAGRVPLGRRLFDAVLARLPEATAALEDLLAAGATPAGAGLLAEAQAQLGATAHGGLPLALLGAGADPFGIDAAGRTPLHLAALHRDTALLGALLERGCNPNARDPGGRTPLFAAIGHGEAGLELVRALVAHGADAETADAHGETPMGLALDHPAIRRWLDWGHWVRPRRPLRADDVPVAARAGAQVAVERLLELGFAADTRDHLGATALLHACGAGHRAIAERLLAAGADDRAAAASGVTPLAAAVAARREPLVELLLAHGTAADQRLPGESTALMLAAGLGHAELAERLLAAGADINAVDGEGRGALHAAARYGFEHNDSLRTRRLFDVLLRRGADVNRADRQGSTALLLLLGAQARPGSPCDGTHIAALVPVLLDAGAAIDHADQRGVSALHACAMHALLPAARVLLARGANRDAADAFGRTPAEVARRLGLVDIAHELAARHHAPPSVQQMLRQPAQPAD